MADGKPRRVEVDADEEDQKDTKPQVPCCFKLMTYLCVCKNYALIRKQLPIALLLLH